MRNQFIALAITMSLQFLLFHLFLLLIPSFSMSSIESNISNAFSSIELSNLDSKTEELMKAISQSIKKFSDCNYIRLERIREVFHELYEFPYFPFVYNRHNQRKDPLSFISELIGEYDHHDEPLEALYNKVMIRLNILKIDHEKNLNFYNDNFIISLYDAVLRNGSHIPAFNSFWYDLTKLIFKWMIHMRQTVASNSKYSRFVQASNGIKLLAPIIAVKAGLNIPIDFNLSSMNYPISSFEELIHSEFYEYSYSIFHSFAFAIKDFYGHGEEGEIRINCREFKNKYFNGRYGKNILLKYLILMYDPIGEMRKCIMEDCFQSEKLESFFILSNCRLDKFMINSNYLYCLISKGPKKLAIINVNYLNKFSIEFLMSSNKKFPISSLYNLFRILRRLKDENLLKLKIIESIIGFEMPDGSLEWNQKTFKDYLNGYRKSIIASIDEQVECDEYLKVIERSNSSPRLYCCFVGSLAKSNKME